MVVVQRGRVRRISTPVTTLARDAAGRWRSSRGDPSAVLGGGAGTAARPGTLGVGEGARDRAERPEVTALLDREQFEALSVEPDQPLLVVGSAGSGKTTVALHRLARIAAEDPRRFPVGRLQVVVPERGLARLAERLLAPLGLSRVKVRTLDAWARATFQAHFGAPPPRLTEETPPLVSRLKRHPALHAALRRRPRAANAPLPGFLALRAELGDLTSDRAFLGEVVASAQGDLPTTAIEETLRHTRLQLASPLALLLRGVDPERAAALDGEAVDARTPDALAGTLDPEDLPLLLYLRSRHGGPAGQGLAHLVVDEAEDVSLFELSVLGRQLGRMRSITLAGDEDQQTTSAFGGWDPMLAAAGAGRAATCRLETTYRCPEPVARLAQEVLGPLARGGVPPSGRGGVPVARFDFPTGAHAQLFVAGAVRDLLEREPLASVAVVAREPQVARSIHRLLEDLARGAAGARRRVRVPARGRPHRRGEREGAGVRLRDRARRLGLGLPGRGRGAPAPARGGDPRLAPAVDRHRGHALAAGGLAAPGGPGRLSGGRAITRTGLAAWRTLPWFNAPARRSEGGHPRLDGRRALDLREGAGRARVRGRPGPGSGSMPTRPGSPRSSATSCTTVRSSRPPAVR